MEIGVRVTLNREEMDAMVLAYLEEHENELGITASEFKVIGLEMIEEGSVMAVDLAPASRVRGSTPPTPRRSG